ncbi:ricin-type beta-trefoil lectin domain protein [Streptomyces olivochromogenes]|uniref:ricin-type beta-trefoil lectin domain protein n=1 Tax=Streptomyces olivochromogenes TaxID=1963 RepID=UPI001F224ABC|nr:ricin-type beta-trefoil lectin domain protein [Streptomyces olivochromogenes]
MNEAGPSNSPTPVRPYDVTDEQLSAELKKWTGTTPALHPVGELLDRHWEAAFAYARLCTDGTRAAGMLTTATFTRLFGESLRQNGPTSAWRPQLLVTVRRIAAEWDTDGRRELLHPDLRSGTGTGDRAAARLLPPANRRLLSRAFQRLPQSARALLWHSEVETEPLAIPAALLGLDEEGARVELGRARDRLREECLQVHRELAPQDECLRYIRMLDVTFRRGVGLDPDLQRHLSGCAHCSHTADQLDRFNGALGVALAEAVLGWGAQAYVEARARLTEGPEEAEYAEGTGQAGAPEHSHPTATAPIGGEPFEASADGDFFASTAPAGSAMGAVFASMAAADTAPGDFSAFTSAGPDAADAFGPTGAAAATPGDKPDRTAPDFRSRRTAPGSRSRRSAPGPRTGSRRTAPGSPRSAQRAARRARRRNLALAVAAVSGLVALPLVLWSVLSSGEGATASGRKPGAGAGSGSPTPGASWIGTSATSQSIVRGRLRNVASGLCVGIVGGKAVQGAETELVKCSSAASRQWTYETNGLLRSAAAPELCLDSRLGYSVRLAPCTGPAQPSAKNVRYEFTAKGALVPRWNRDLALTPAATDGAGALVLKTRADTPVQYWTIDTSKPDLQMLAVNWDAESTPSPAAGTGSAPGATHTPSPSPSASGPTARPAPSRSGSADPCDYSPYSCYPDGRDGGWDHHHDYGSGGGRGGR